MKKNFLIFIAALLLTLPVCAQTTGGVRFIPLYPNGTSDSNGLDASKAEDSGSHLTQAADADYAVFLPKKGEGTGQAVVVCPGGSYHGVAYMHEGVDVARWLSDQGVAAFVLRYRMPNGHSEIPLRDVQEIFRKVRANASEWGIDPDNVGIMGFSAGGHLAATSLTTVSGEGGDPDFAVLYYPVISMKEEFAHLGSRYNLIGRQYDAKLVEKYSRDQQVNKDTPRCLIFFSSDDDAVNPVNGTLMYDALVRNGVPAEMHMYPSGRHGWGWKPGFKYHDEMAATLARWLKESDTRGR